MNTEYSGQPYLVDEYGGIKWDPETQGDMSLSKAQNLTSWGYGDAVHSEDEFFTRLEKLTDVILSMDHICGRTVCISMTDLPSSTHPDSAAYSQENRMVMTSDSGIN